ncbi:hypothetical protein PVAP13_9KG185700 [Panicum virgatum]|uniref:Uncharacterized protein n=1 Tax=Panicum virgatum TaxID=38727 RepID=A0A8T0NNI0_PANVG|nr:hypothetical protein PVAP13_9KG185700 [Panicum virgatum]
MHLAAEQRLFPATSRKRCLPQGCTVPWCGGTRATQRRRPRRRQAEEEGWRTTIQSWLIDHHRTQRSSPTTNGLIGWWQVLTSNSLTLK